MARARRVREGYPAASEYISRSSTLTTRSVSHLAPAGVAKLAEPVDKPVDRHSPRASGACRRSIVVPTSAGTRRRLAREPSTMTANASGTVHAAGTLTRIAAQPDSGGPTMV